MLTDTIDPNISNGVAIIGGKYLITKGIDTVSWYWTDDEGQLYTNELNNILYFPDSTIKILSTTALDKYIKDDEGSFVITKRNYYFLLGILLSTKIQ